jgi:hypothetical protein
MRIRGDVGVAAVLLLMAGGSDAQAKIVIWGSGDTIAQVAPLPADSPAIPKGKPLVGEKPTKVGYKHYRFHIFWVPFWTSTSEGEFVAYHETGLTGSWYQPLGRNAEEVSWKTRVPVADLKIPWSARNPWGLYVVLGLAGGWVVFHLIRWAVDRSAEPTRPEPLPPAPRPPADLATLPKYPGASGG